jgi:7,8-dihydropterin-6-yl-methyl-4-(beta-D-ribofuranosyl)aminobenzene 5'-phosphate synthase
MANGFGGGVGGSYGEICGALTIDPADLDAIAISHGHRDHTGGIEELMDYVRPDLPLYAHPMLFRERFSRSDKTLRPIGIPVSRSEMAERFDLRLSAEPLEVLPGVWTSGEITSRPEPEGRSPRHLVRGDDEMVPDPYRDDMSLVLELPAGLVLMCGCCHAGLLNTIHCVERRFEGDIIAIAGGTHLAAADEAELMHVGETLRNMGPVQRLWLNHCSGEATVGRLRRVLGEQRVDPLPAGSILEFDQLLRARA